MLNKCKQMNYIKLIFLALILMIKTPINFASSLPETAQQGIRVTGTVVDETGDPLPGVAVVVSGTTVGTTTDWNGVFTINVPNEAAVLQFTFLGYATQDIVVGNRRVIDVKMSEASSELEEVVVVGYGQQRKVTVTGAITTLTNVELKQSPTSNLSNALAGRMPGLMVNQYAGGEPGADVSEIFVRGMATYNTDNNAQRPIMIVDGVEREFQQLSADEVETITILKDASSTAVYGVKGANGVILVTTKRGKSEKPVVTLKLSAGHSEPVKFPQYLGSADYAMLYNEARNNDKSTGVARFSPSAIENFRNAKGDNSDGLGYNMNLFDHAFKPSWQQDYSLSVSGGTQRTRYFVMAGYINQDGNYKNTDMGKFNTQTRFMRYNFRSNIDINITDDWYVRLDLGGRVQDRYMPGTDAGTVVEVCNSQPPYFPLFVDDNGHPNNEQFREFNPNGMLFGNQVYRVNLIGELAYRGYKNEYITNMQGSFIMGYKLDKLVKGLKVEGMFSYDTKSGNRVDRVANTEGEGYRTYNGYAMFFPAEGGVDYYMDVAANGVNGTYRGTYLYPRLTQNNPLGNSIVTQGTNTDDSRLNPDRTTYGQFSLNYARSFGKHYVTGLLLGQRKQRVYSNQVPYASQGLAGRITYNFDERYLAEISAGYNGSENFAKGYRYGLFPALSAGWVISNEGFFKTDGIINYLKIRGSVGLVGNDQIAGGRFAYLQLYLPNGRWRGGMDLNSDYDAGYVESPTLANPKLSWEKARKYNIGIDLKAFKNRLSFEGDVFFEHRYDIITSSGTATETMQGLIKDYPQVVGRTMPPLNVGKVNNKGIEFQVTWQDKIGQNFSYFIRPNFSFSRNKIINMNEIDRIMSNGEDATWSYRTGRRIGEQFVYVFDHFVRNEDEAKALNDSKYQSWGGTLIPGDIVYKDISGDGKVVEQEDQVSMGHPRRPEIQFGIPLGVQYRGFDLSFVFQGAANTSLLLTGPAVWEFPMYKQDIIGKVKPLHLGRWTPETAETATYPVLHYGTFTNTKNAANGLFLHDASYLRLKTIEIGYRLPYDLVKKVGMSGVRFYIQGMNLLTWDKLTKYDVDPETQSNGNWYPIQKIYQFGVNIDF